MSAPDTAPAELTQRQVIDVLFRDKAARAYTFTALGALALVFAILYTNGSDVGGVIVALFGCAALVLRWTAAPPFLLLVVAYFQLFPFGIPDGLSENPFQVRETHFQVADLALVLALLVYLRAQYRIFGLVHQIVPPDGPLKRKGEAQTRRPTAHIRPDEVAWLVGTAGAVVLVGQFAWWLANSLEVAPLAEFPLRWANESDMTRYRPNTGPGEFRPGQHRFFVILGGLLFGTLVLRLVFDYWRWRVMGATEGAMVLTDTSWAESHRERVRVEKWRAWGQRRAEEQEKEAERARREAERAHEQREAKERERQKKEEKARRFKRR